MVFGGGKKMRPLGAKGATQFLVRLREEVEFVPPQGAQMRVFAGCQPGYQMM